MDTNKNMERIFKENKFSVADNGFSEKVMEALPDKKNRLPIFIVTGFFMVGVLLTLVLQGSGTSEWIRGAVEAGEFSGGSVAGSFAGLISLVATALSICYAAGSLVLKRSE